MDSLLTYYEVFGLLFSRYYHYTIVLWILAQIQKSWQTRTTIGHRGQILTTSCRSYSHNTSANTISIYEDFNILHLKHARLQTGIIHKNRWVGFHFSPCFLLLCACFCYRLYSWLLSVCVLYNNIISHVLTLLDTHKESQNSVGTD